MTISVGDFNDRAEVKPRRLQRLGRSETLETPMLREATNLGELFGRWLSFAKALVSFCEL